MVGSGTKAMTKCEAQEIFLFVSEIILLGFSCLTYRRQQNV